MNKVKTLAYTTLAVAGLGLGLLNPNYAMAQKQDKDEGISFYEHKDLNNNGKVDSGETSKLARIVFEEGENIAIDSKFKEGTGNLYVISERGDIVKTIPQQYETGVKTAKLLENLPSGKYTTVFQKDNSNELNGSFMAIVPEGESKDIKFGRIEDKFEGKKNYEFVCNNWNDLNKDKHPQLWEVSGNQLEDKGCLSSFGVSEGVSPKIVYRNRMSPKVVLKLTKEKDNSFKKVKMTAKKAGRTPVMVTLPVSDKGEYKLRVNQGAVMINVK